MKYLTEFEIHAGMFAVFWLTTSLYSVWKTKKTYNERAEKFKKSTDNLVSAIQMLPFPQIFPLLFIGVFLFYISIDVIGVALLHSFIGKADWIVDILSVILLLKVVYNFSDLINDLRAMGDDQKFRERLYDYPSPRKRRVLDVVLWVRFMASLILFIGVYL